MGHLARGLVGSQLFAPSAEALTYSIVKHQSGNWLVDNGLIIYRHELFADYLSCGTSLCHNRQQG